MVTVNGTFSQQKKEKKTTYLKNRWALDLLIKCRNKWNFPSKLLHRSVALYLTQHFCKTFHAPLNTCRVAIASFDPRDNNNDEHSLEDDLWLSCWNKVFLRRGILQPIHSMNMMSDLLSEEGAATPCAAHDSDGLDDLYDVIIVTASWRMNQKNTDAATFSQITRRLVPGGLFILTSTTAATPFSMDSNVWSTPTVLDSHGGTDVFLVWSKLLCPINTESCRHWLSSKHSLSDEKVHLHQATVAPSAAQCLSLRDIQDDLPNNANNNTNKSLILSSAQHQKAITALASGGYCILRNVLSPSRCQAFGCAVLRDLQLANSILQDKYQVDVYQPQTNPDSYRELSMREDLRMDLRDGPQLRQERQRYNESRDGSSGGALFWQSSDLVHIVQQVMYPRREEYRHGNFGRYNFDGIAEDDESNNNNASSLLSCPPLKRSAVGGIISLPGSADQALHADIPHLFEHEDCLPAHYINAFTPGCYHNDPRIGGTALIHGSHRLSFTAKYTPTNTATTSTTTATALKHEIYVHYLVRPWLQPGDVLLFDCRILHFGLANLGNEPRPIIYTNITHAWFHDPKNWDDRQAIFDARHFDERNNNNYDDKETGEIPKH